MEKLDTKIESEVDIVDPSTPLVAVASVREGTTSSTALDDADIHRKGEGEAPVQYRLYKRRWWGIVALVLLNIVKGMNWVWFGAIANATTKEFNITLDEVNWFGNIPHLSYLVFSWCVPILVRRFGLRNTSVFGAVILVVLAWIRVCGTINSLSSSGSFALILVAQLLVGLVAPCFQVVGPRYAEVWFDLKGRATATMIVAISDPLGTAVGQIVSPFLTNIRSGILVLAIITSASLPLSFAVLASPPSPPTYSGSLTSPPLSQTLRAALNFNLGPIKLRRREGEQFLTRTERIDFFILFFVFGVLVAGTSSFSVFIAQIFAPHGYSDVTSGLMGGIFLLSGLLAALISAPLFDRVLIHHLAKTVKLALPILSIAWVCLIFVVKPNNLGGIFVVLVAISSVSFILLPVGLELGVEITHNAETSTAILWSGGNLVSVLWVLAMNALRDGPDGNPPLNMKRALIFNAAFIAGTTLLTIPFTGAQTRRKIDEQKAKDASAIQMEDVQT